MKWTKLGIGLLIALGLVAYGGTYQTTIPPDGTIDYSKLSAWELEQLLGHVKQYGKPGEGDTLMWGRSPTLQGEYILSVNAAGDTLALINYRYDASGGEDYGIFGPLWRLQAGGAAGVADSYLVWCLHDFHAIVPFGAGALPRSGNKLSQDTGAGVDFRLIDTSDVFIGNDVIVIRDEWEYIRGVSGDSLRLIVARTMTARKGEPYFLLNYEFSCGDSINNADTLRLMWSDEPGMGYAGHPGKLAGTAADGGRYDVGHVPGYGLVRRRYEFESEELSAMAGGLVMGMLNVGNPAEASETLSTGGSAVLNDTLKTDFGSGTRTFVGGFVAFNHNCDVYPTQFVFSDLSPTSLAGCHFDTARISVDTTKVIGAYADNASRFVIGRTDQFVVHTLDYPAKTMTAAVTFEYAIGRVYITDDGLVHYPHITFTDGTEIRPKIYSVK